MEIGNCALAQGNYHLATKKFTQAGDKVRHLIETGDTKSKTTGSFSEKLLHLGIFVCSHSIIYLIIYSLNLSSLSHINVK